MSDFEHNNRAPMNRGESGRLPVNERTISADALRTQNYAMIILPEALTSGSSSDVNLLAKNSMNCGLQYDARHSLFAGLNLENHWLNHGLQSAFKQEPRDEGELGSFKKDGNAAAPFTAPLTPPGLSAAFNGMPTPQSDYPSSSSPQQEFNNNNKVPAGSGGSSTVPVPAATAAEMPAAPTTPKSDSGKTSPRLTPPGSIPSPMGGDGMDKHQMDNEGSQSSNSENEFYENGDSLKRLQLALQRPGMMPEEKLQCPMCEFSCHVRSQFNEHLIAHETKCNMCDFNTDTADKLREHLKKVHDCDEDLWVEDEPGLTLPKVNSQGKVKTFRCKQCDFSAVTKLEFWEHSRVHIKQERLLTCPKCPFVTEYKHHLEYHLRNHFGSKPFKCDKCSYSCVNKSMLNSHLKSHSNVYQFRCNDCTYATKYCHSLKLHLRKYRHSPAMVLNSDGSPNPLPIVDVYGTKRGPKQKNKAEKRAQQAARQQEKQLQQQQQQQQPQQSQQQLPMHIFNPYSLLPTQMPYYNILNSFPPFPFSQDAKQEGEKNNNIEKPDESMDDEELEESSKEDEPNKAPLDLTCWEKSDTEGPSQNETPVMKNRRKGKAFKLERTLRLPSSDDEPDQIISKPDIYPDESKSPDLKSSCETDSEPPKSDKASEDTVYTCTYCDMTFKDIIMYTMHMGYHGYQDPFTCNMCGQQTSDKVSFFLHIARTSHS